MKLDAMIVGAQKAGTTALMSHLAGCEAISVQVSFEFPYFAVDRLYGQGLESNVERCFDDTSGMLVAKNVGVMFLPWARERLFDHNPNCRIIVCLRDPVLRAHSAYWYLRKTGHETLKTFEAALDAESARLEDLRDNHHFAYVGRGQYYSQLRELEALFGRNNICLLSSTDLRTQPRVELARVLRFLDLDGSCALDAEESLRVNRSARARSTTLARLLHQPAYDSRAGLARRAIRAVPGARKRLLPLVRKLNEQGTFSSPALAAPTRARLTAEFTDSNTQLKEYFGFDTSVWS